MTAKCSLLRNPKIVGNTCIARLTDTTTVKIEFAKGIEADRRYGILVTVLNRKEGKIDSLTIRFSDILNTKEVYIWTAYSEPEWYGDSPAANDYAETAKAIGDYLENFAD